MTIFEKLRSSISAKLLLSFLAFAALSVIAFTLSINSLLISQNSEKRLADFTLPLLQDTQVLAQTVSNYIISIERLPPRTLPEAGARELAESEKAIEAVFGTIENKLPSRELIEPIRELLTSMRSGSQELTNLVVKEQPYLNNEIGSGRDKINATLDEIRGAIKKLQVRMILSKSNTAENRSKIANLTNILAEIRVAVDRYNPVFPIPEIRALQNSYTNSVRRLVTSNLSVSDLEIRAEISRQVDVLLENIGADASFFNNAIKLANLRKNVGETIQNNRTLENQLIGEISNLVERASTDTTKELADINDTLSANIQTLAFVMVVSIVIAISIVFFYVNPNVISRLNNLAVETQRIADGDYKTEISTLGNDEISRMSKALETFRNGLIDKEELLERLVASNEELERFAYVCSHDLQEPVRMIRAFSEKLEERIADKIENDETAKVYLHQVTDAAGRSQTLIRDIMAYSRFDREIEAFNNVDLNEVVEETIVSMKDQVSDKLPAVSFNNLPTIKGNKTQMYQLFNNLIANGLKYNKNGKDARVEVFSSDRDEVWEITVKDNGIGIEPRHQEQIFEVFRRLHRKEEYPGTGIGLAICKKIVENHHGTIEVDSAIGKGTAFTFTLLKEAS